MQLPQTNPVRKLPILPQVEGQVQFPHSLHSELQFEQLLQEQLFDIVNRNSRGNNELLNISVLLVFDIIIL